MSITFGSVGDIIAVCLLVKDLVQALDQVRGSKAEYQEAIQELRILDRVLLEVELITKAHENAHIPELQSLCETAKITVVRMQSLVTTFLERIKRYQITLDEGQSTGMVKDVFEKIRWRIGERDALEKFRVEVAGTSSSLQLLLGTANMTLLDLKGKESVQRFASLDQQIVRSDAQHSEALERIRERIEDTERQINTGNTILKQISSTLRLDWFRQLGGDLMALMRRTIALNIATYHAVVSMQAALANRLERSLIEEPFVLEDPLGRIAPVHLQFVTSWEAFHAILECRFQNLQGFRKVKQRKYGLQDRATRRRIDQGQSWQRAFLPGQRVDMAFIFEGHEIGEANAAKTTCPGCQTPSSGTSDAEVQCENCLMWYCRITAVEEMEVALNPMEMSPKTKVSGPAPPGRLEDTADNTEMEDEIREFKRVRLVLTKARAKRPSFSERDKASEINNKPDGHDRKSNSPQIPSADPQVEIFKSFRVSIDDPTHKILPVALKKYNITADWRQYALYIVHGDQERCLGLNERPLILFKQLDKEGRKPMFMLRKHAAPEQGHVRTVGSNDVRAVPPNSGFGWDSVGRGISRADLEVERLMKELQDERNNNQRLRKIIEKNGIVEEDKTRM